MQARLDVQAPIYESGDNVRFLSGDYRGTEGRVVALTSTVYGEPALGYRVMLPGRRLVEVRRSWVERMAAD